jgi:ribonuclease D
MTSNHRMIDTDAGLADMLPELAQATEVAVDLEADSMYHYQEKVCLVQMATDRLNLVIDPLPITNFRILAPVFADGAVRKIFHGADYDVRSLYRDFGIVIHNLFDTQVAATFLGMRETGLDAVLRARMGIPLDKKYQKKDWSRRPLPPEMVEYAASDAIHLLPLARMLEKEVVEKGRLAWVEEECRLLSQVRPAMEEDSPLFLKVKGAGKLDRRGLAVLEKLLCFRHRIAEKKDRPLFKVFGNRSLLRIAAERPRNVRALTETGALSARQVAMHGEAVLGCVAEGLAVSSRDLPVYPRRRSPSVPAAVPDRIKAIKAWRDGKADRLGVDPTLILNKAMMGAIAMEKPATVTQLADIDGVKDWQHKSFGQQIVGVLKGMK